MTEPSQEQLYAKFQSNALLMKLRFFIDRATGKDGVLERIHSDASKAECERTDAGYTAQYPGHKFPPRWAHVPPQCEHDWKDAESFASSVNRMVRLATLLSTSDDLCDSVSPNKICEEAEKS